MTNDITAEPPAQPKKKRRVFLWIFLAVNLLFIIWIIGGIASGGDASDCGSLSQEDCQAASDVGTGIGVFLILVLWVIVDVLLFIPWVIYKLARR